jgi:hypothetical protein
MEWARSTWETEVLRLGGALISDAFKANQTQLLRQEPYAGALTRMKQVWRERRDSLFPLKVPPDLSSLLSLHM